MEIHVPWTTHGYADWTLQMLDCHAEVFDCCDIHSTREWAEYAIWNGAGDKWARGSARDVSEAKGIVEDHIRLRWNARAGVVIE